ncbi:MAG: mycofactocin biosynthesis peptidyl-dipeptidase MftE [Actinomycetota bacterium]|nr:mycofactocin biosynthesis peptidyl-dipeptidase MftE [Actinomycetota bacterium]
MSELAAATSPELARPGGVLLVPVGSTEQHGPHLPLGTDTLVAEAVARRLAAGLPGAVVAPALPYGSSGEHAGFAGTVSIGQEALEAVVVELGRSASATFPAVVVVSGHGGNAAPLRRAVGRLVAEGRRARLVAPAFHGDAHAGRTETALLLALAPSLVRSEQVAAGVTTSLPELLPELRRSGVAAVSPNGVLGDPRGATAEEGHALLEAAVAGLAADLRAWLDGQEVAP